MKDNVFLGAIGVAGVVVMTVACFHYTGQDGTVLAAAAGAIGTIIGVVLGRKSVSIHGTGGP